MRAGIVKDYIKMNIAGKLYGSIGSSDLPIMISLYKHDIHNYMSRHMKTSRGAFAKMYKRGWKKSKLNGKKKLKE